MYCQTCGAVLTGDICTACGAKAASATQQAPPAAQPGMVLVPERSYFDGGLLQLMGWTVLGTLLTTITLGICYPWSLCMKYGWEIKHTVIDGRRLCFTGNAAQLFGNWIKWLLLCILTLGIYGFWLHIALKKWKVKHTVFAG